MPELKTKVRDLLDAHDLDVVQRHTRQFFDIPQFMQPGDRVKLRVARLLVERREGERERITIRVFPRA